MSRSPWLEPLAILLVIVSILTGCASARPGVVTEDSVSAAVATDGDEGATKAHRGHDARAALLVVAVIFFALVVVADLLILPCTIPMHRPFCCTHEVVVICFR